MKVVVNAGCRDTLIVMMFCMVTIYV
jgi:hypothetical protein